MNKYLVFTFLICIIFYTYTIMYIPISPTSNISNINNKYHDTSDYEKYQYDILKKHLK